MARRAPEHIEVYAPDQSYSGPPSSVISFEEANNRVESGEASWCKHNRGIRMRPIAPLALRNDRCGSVECDQRFLDYALGIRSAK
jgi:hypothetical protein